MQFCCCQTCPPFTWFLIHCTQWKHELTFYLRIHGTFKLSLKQAMISSFLPELNWTSSLRFEVVWCHLRTYATLHLNVVYWSVDRWMSGALKLFNYASWHVIVHAWCCFRRPKINLSLPLFIFHLVISLQSHYLHRTGEGRKERNEHRREERRKHT